MIKIGIDCRFASSPSGPGRYNASVTHELLNRNDGLTYVLFCNEDEPTWIPANTASSYRIVPAPMPHYSVAEHLSLPQIIAREQLALYVCPHFNVPYFMPAPFICTIHDLILHRFPNTSSILKKVAYRMLMRRAVERSEAIIAVSDFTKRELLATYGLKHETKISRIYNGLESRFAPSSPEKITHVKNLYSLQKPYFLYVGNAKEHKRVPELIAAYQSLNTNDVDLVLLCYGREADKLTLCPGVHVLKDVTDEHLQALYTGARALVTATAYEGFGLPVAEAQACGTRVIAPRASSIPEVVNDQARLVAADLGDLPTALHEATTWNDEPGPITQPQDWSWETAAKETAAVIQSCVQ